MAAQRWVGILGAQRQLDDLQEMLAALRKHFKGFLKTSKVRLRHNLVGSLKRLTKFQSHDLLSLHAGSSGICEASGSHIGTHSR